MTFDHIYHRLLQRPYRLHINHSGDMTKPVIVLLHGIAASGDDWQKVLPHLETNYHCITIDLLGFGKSPKPQWAAYAMDDHMRSLFHTMNKLRLHTHFTLVGHSLGALLATRYATEHESNLASLVLLSPPVYPALDTIHDWTARQRTSLLLKLYTFIRTSEHLTQESFRKLRFIAPVPKGVIADPDTWLPFMRTLRECIEKQTILHDISVLSLPIDIFYGTADQVVVGANVKLLARHPNIEVHTFLGNHDLTSRYGKLLAKTLGE